jgi:hypothetical protein
MSTKYPGGFITKSPTAPSQGIAPGIWTLEQALQFKKQGVWPPLVPGAPTIGTATQTGSTTATVAFTAPASNGGSVITSYTATSSPDGITGTLSQAGSGTITVTGLSPSTSYTFTVTATNAIGTSAASAASNSITTALPTVGSAFGGGFFAGQISTAGNSVADYNLVVGPLASAQSELQFRTTNTGGDPTSVIDGPTNSATMNNAAHPAAQFCEGLNVGGQTDWYMPAKNELEVCYYNLKPNTTQNNTSTGANPNAVPARASNYTGGSPPTNPAQTIATNFQTGNTEPFDAGFNYWASTEVSAAIAFRQSFGSGYMQSGSSTYGKTGSYKVRAVRRVAV